MPPRVIAVGDIHGCSAALDALIAAVAPRREDTVVTLGDYVDRGPDSRGVLDRLIALGRTCRLVPLLGNHDEMFLHAISGEGDAILWRAVGGLATLRSYGDEHDPSSVPPEHVRFLKGCRLYHESRTHLFVHANYWPDLPMEEQGESVLLWGSLREHVPGPHVSGKVAIVGHTSQKDGEVLDLGHIKCIDTFCYGGGWLTALDVATGHLWQASESGRLRP